MANHLPGTALETTRTGSTTRTGGRGAGHTGGSGELQRHDGVLLDGGVVGDAGNVGLVGGDGAEARECQLDGVLGGGVSSDSGVSDGVDGGLRS